MMRLALLLVVFTLELWRGLGYSFRPFTTRDGGGWVSRRCARLGSASTDEVIAVGEPPREKEMLHVLHHSGDLEGVVKLFADALELDLEKEKEKETGTLGIDAPVIQVAHPYLEDSYYYNIGLQALLRTKRHEMAKSILQRGVIDRGVAFGADTVHIFIRDAFQRGVPEEACAMFDTYFEGANQPRRSTMSINMMVEGFRNAGLFEQARRYVNAMEEKAYGADLVADSYTFSSLVRMANTSREIWRLLDTAESTNQTSVPFLRCCVESFGKTGCPGDALKVYTRYLAPQEGSRKSGDALLAALLSYKSVSKPLSGGDTSGHVALALAGLLLEEEGEEKEKAKEKEEEEMKVRWGARGYNLLFTYVSSMDGSKSKYSYNGRTNDDNNALRLKVRNRLRSQLLDDMNTAMDGTSSTSSSSRQSSMLPNGRVCDALLRSFSDDIEVGRAVWKRDLLPVARRMEVLQPGSFLEITEKCFVALMFGCGRCSRPDIGMEIARAARKSAWSPEEIAKLAGAYNQGCRSARNQQDISAFSLRKIFDRGMDQSLRIELGLVDVDTTAGPNIRIQFEDR